MKVLPVFFWGAGEGACPGHNEHIQLDYRAACTAVTMTTAGGYLQAAGASHCPLFDLVTHHLLSWKLGSFSVSLSLQKCSVCLCSSAAGHVTARLGAANKPLASSLTFDLSSLNFVRDS